MTCPVLSYPKQRGTDTRCRQCRACVIDMNFPTPNSTNTSTKACHWPRIKTCKLHHYDRSSRPLLKRSLRPWTVFFSIKLSFFWIAVIHSRYRHDLSQPIRLYLLTHTPASFATTTFYNIRTTRSPSAQSLLRSAEQLPPSQMRERALPVQQHLPSGARKRCPRAAQQHPQSDALRAPRQA